MADESKVTVKKVPYNPDTSLQATEQTSVNTAVATQVSKATNVYGQNLIKGSSLIGSGLFESIGTAYSNLTYRPLAITLLIIGTFGLLAEANNVVGPLERMHNATLAYTKDTTHPRLLNALAACLAWIINFLISIKVFFLTLIIFWGVYMAKPSSNNLYIALVLTVWGTFSGVSFWDTILVSQCFFLFTQLRAPWMKFLILAITLVGLIIGFETMSDYASLGDMELIPNPGNGGGGTVDPPGNLRKSVRINTPKGKSNGTA